MSNRWLSATAFVTVASTAGILAPQAGSAQEVEASAEVGWVSEYYFRGIPQKTSSASVGVEVGQAGFYLGSWAADVGEGAEVDLYGGYTQAVGPFTLGIGGTGYFYTGTFDDTYLEANLLGGLGPFEVEFSFGRWEAFDAPPEDYTFLAITASHEGFHLGGGTFGGDFGGSFAEVGYSFSVAELDIGISWILSDQELSGRERSDDTLILGFTRTFDLLGR